MENTMKECVRCGHRWTDDTDVLELPIDPETELGPLCAACASEAGVDEEADGST